MAPFGGVRYLCFLAGLMTFATPLVAGCSGSNQGSDRSPGALALSLELAGGRDIDEVLYVISGDGMDDMTGKIDTSAPGATASIEVYGLPPGGDYVVALTATSADGEVTCAGSGSFDIETNATTDVSVYLRCKFEPRLGSVRVNGNFNFCAQLAKVVVSPLQTSVGASIDLSAAAADAEDDPVSLSWVAAGGEIESPSDPNTRFTCTDAGAFSIVASVSDDPHCIDEWAVTVTCVGETTRECVTDVDCIGVFPLPTCRFPTTCSAAGTCVRGDLLSEGTACLRGGECDEEGVCRGPWCTVDSDCEEFNEPDECRESFRCVSNPFNSDPIFNACEQGAPLPSGTPCSAGACDGFGKCLGEGNPLKSQVMRVACKNNVSVDPSYLPSLLTVTPPRAWKADPTETDVWEIGGEAVFDKEFLDAAQAVLPGGVTEANLVDLKWTVQVRSGATMDDVTLGPTELPYTCERDRSALCDPLNDLPGAGGNSDCTPSGGFNACSRFVDLPISTDCAPGGLCRSAGAAPTSQCEANGFCISDQLRIPLESQAVEVTPDAAGAYVTFGWHDTPNRGLNSDGTYILPTAVYPAPTGPVGFRSKVGPLTTALECMLGGDAGWTNLGPYPVPDELLLQYFVPAP